MALWTFPNFEDQEKVLRLIKGVKQQVQLEILKLSEGDIDKIRDLVGLALEGYFTPYICKGLESCPYIPESCKDKVLEIVMAHSNKVVLQNLPITSFNFRARERKKA